MNIILDDKIFGRRQSISFYMKWGVVCLVVLMFTSYLWFNYSTIETIQNVQILSIEDNDGRLLILTDKGAFENTNSIMHYKTHSTDIQSKLAPGDIVRTTVYGLRISKFSIYQNVLEIQNYNKEK